MSFKKEKIKQLIHYLIYKCQNKKTFGKTVLFKLMYFSEFNYYELYGKSITDEIYKKLPHGPVPNNFNECFSELKIENKVNEKNNPFYNDIISRYGSLKKPDTSLLSDKELNVIDDVIKNLSNLNSVEISEYCNGDNPWRLTKFHSKINPEFVFYRDTKYSVRK